jgi:hypothetical protein
VRLWFICSLVVLCFDRIRSERCSDQAATGAIKTHLCSLQLSPGEMMNGARVVSILKVTSSLLLAKDTNEAARCFLQLPDLALFFRERIASAFPTGTSRATTIYPLYCDSVTEWSTGVGSCTSGTTRTETAWLVCSSPRRASPSYHWHSSTSSCPGAMAPC